MTREQLKELGLTDEQIDSVMKAYGKSVNEYKAKAEQADSLQGQIDDYKEQINERDEQLEELSEKAEGNEDLTAQIEELKQQNEQTAKEYEVKLSEQEFNHKLETTLSSEKVRNAKAVKALLDLDIIKLEDGELKGLNEQLESLQESDSYLFEQEKETEPKPRFSTGDHQSNDNNQDDDPFAKKLAQYQ